MKIYTVRHCKQTEMLWGTIDIDAFYIGVSKCINSWIFLKERWNGTGKTKFILKAFDISLFYVSHYILFLLTYKSRFIKISVIQILYLLLLLANNSKGFICFRLIIYLVSVLWNFLFYIFDTLYILSKRSTHN